MDIAAGRDVAAAEADAASTTAAYVRGEDTATDPDGAHPRLPTQVIEVGDLVVAMDRARGSWDRGDIIDFSHGVAHYLKDLGAHIYLSGREIDPDTYTGVQWRRMVRALNVLDDPR
jgi:hypothetical protein